MKRLLNSVSQLLLVLVLGVSLSGCVTTHVPTASTSPWQAEDLDALAFRCPVCRSKVAAFRDIGPRAKASGFDENLDFGLGVNRMTPGQKNVLIFGSLALGFAFFLSLYSLR
jgi:ABC-type uncharacterized transport system permease subunit